MLVQRSLDYRFYCETIHCWGNSRNALLFLRLFDKTAVGTSAFRHCFGSVHRTDNKTAVDCFAWDSCSFELSWLTEHLAVSGCFSGDYVTELASEQRIGGVIDLRDEDCDDEDALRAAGLEFLHLPTPDLYAVCIEELQRGVQFAREFIDRGERVLIHCQHGIGRSPLLALCVMVDLGMEPLDALRQAKDRRRAVSPSEAQYRGWAEWLKRNGREAPDYHAFGCIAYRHLAEA